MKKAFRNVRESYRLPHVQWYTLAASLFVAAAIQIAIIVQSVIQ